MSYEYMTGMGAETENATPLWFENIVGSIGLAHPEEIGQPCTEVPNGIKEARSNTSIMTSFGCVDTGRTIYEQGPRLPGYTGTTKKIFCCPQDWREQAALPTSSLAPTPLPPAPTQPLPPLAERQAEQQALFERCVAAGHPITWKSDAPLTRAQAHFEHFEGPTCYRSGQSRESSFPTWALQQGGFYSGQAIRDWESCCHPRDVELPAVVAPPVTNGAVTNGAAPANGNGAAVAVVPAEEEEKYFGFTIQQLMLMGAGGIVLYMVLK